jgi:Tripartite tricarboxylate transporter family receptor
MGAGPMTFAGAPLQQGRSNESADVVRCFSHCLVGMAGVIATLLAGPAPAEEWPTRPLTMVAPFAAGGSTDAIARIVADGLSSQLQQTVIVENVGGAGGMTGANRVARATPDGYQFVLGNVGTHAQNQSLYKKPLYNALTDFAPVALVTDQSLVLVARKDFPAKTLPEFIAYAKANQSKLQYGSAGVGGSMRRSVSRSRMYPIAAAARRCRISWRAASITSAQAPRRRCRRSTARPSRRSRS